jgi:hypothetical protein
MSTDEVAATAGAPENRIHTAATKVLLANNSFTAPPDMTATRWKTLRLIALNIEVNL